jgi:hypothetical protein
LARKWRYRAMEKAVVEEKEMAPARKAQGWRKFLKGFGKFMMYGGWLIIVVLVLGIIIAISVLGQ